MAITPTNIFQYYAALSKKRRLDAKESRVRSREMMISFQQTPVAPVSTEDKFVNAQKFFEMGFRAGVREAIAQSQSDPSSGGGLGLGLGNNITIFFWNRWYNEKRTGWPSRKRSIILSW